MRFVVQEHFSRSHHFDFRLEYEGVFKSWAVPKSIPEEPGVARLALQVDDHELSFGDFEGEIPEGQRGAGRIRLWDCGMYERQSWTMNRIEVKLHGSRLKGDYVLMRLRKVGNREWLLYKRKY